METDGWSLVGCWYVRYRIGYCRYVALFFPQKPYRESIDLPILQMKKMRPRVQLSHILEDNAVRQQWGWDSDPCLETKLLSTHNVLIIKPSRGAFLSPCPFFLSLLSLHKPAVIVFRCQNSSKIFKQSAD